MRASWHLLFCGLSLAFSLRGQSDNWQEIGLEEGLPSTIINNIETGPKGFMWLASEGAGLIRYDGTSFETFFLEEFPVVEELVCSWRGERLYLRDGRRVMEYNGLASSYLPLEEDQRVLDLCNVGQALYLALSDGLYHWDGDSLQFKAHLPPGFRRLSSVANGLFAQSDSAVYRWTNRWTKKKDSLQLIDGNPQAYLRHNELYNLRNEKILSLPIAPDDSLLQTYSDASEFLGLSPDSILWIKFGSDEQRMRSFKAALPQGLKGEAVKGMFVSGGSILLIHDEGLYRQSGVFQELQPQPSPILSLELHQGQAFLGTAQGLRSKSYRNRVLPVNGLILASCHLGDSLLIATESGVFYKTRPKESLMPSPVKGFVFSLISTGREVWAAASSGIWRLKEGRWALIKDAGELDYASIFSIKAAQSDDFWFASYTKGLWRLMEGAWQPFRKLAGISLDSIGLTAIQPLSGNRLAVGTRSNGLFIFDLQTNSHQHLSFKDLEFAEIRAFTLLGEQLWIGTNKGLISLIDVLESRKAGESGGLHFMGIPINSSCLQSENGSLYAGGDKALFVARLSFLEAVYPHSNPRLLEAECLQDEGAEILEAFPREPFSGLYLFGKLDYDQNYMRFRFGLRSLFYPELVHYRYRLIGQTENWTYAGSTREAMFSDLKPGTYQLEVQARYPWQGWELKAEPYTFYVQQAIWRTLWFWLSIGLLLAALLYFYVRDRWQRQKERLKLENDLLEMERKALRLQMNPHFIFNALDSISSFIFKKDPKMAVRYLNNFAKLMRLTLESSMEHIHPVETEVSILKNYLELEKLRFSGKFDYEIEVDEELDYTVGLPPMLIQPHVENAILHGLKPKESAGFLRISFKLQETKLCCTIEDNGIGREKARELPNKKAHRSMATQINRDRINLLRQSVDELIDLNIIDKYNQEGEACGTKVVIRLPAQEL